jgi:hypothetical protein
MSSRWDHQIDPALVELFQELASDPRSSLLRVPIRGTGAISSTKEVSPRAANLIAAERELLEVFRHEVRDLLLEACRRELYGLSGLQLSRWQSFDTRVHIAPEKDWLGRVSRTLDDVPEEIAAGGALNLLSACVVNPGGKSPKVSQFAGAAQRVLFDDRARIYAALELLSEESPRAAMSLLNGVLDDKPESGLSSYCWQNLGVSQHRMGDISAALKSYERASLLGDARPGPLLSAFSAALAVEDDMRAEHFSAELEDRMGVDHPGLAEEIQLLRKLTCSEATGIKVMRKETFVRIEDRLGIIGRRIGNALIE